MSERDASFAEGRDEPLRLWAVDEEDLQVIAALAQDAVFPASEMAWLRAERQFVALINRVRWEDVELARRLGRPVERVQALLIVSDVEGVETRGVTPGDRDTVLSLLDIQFERTDETAGHVYLILAGDGEIRIRVEDLDVRLKDVTQPYAAPSGHIPSHPD